ncbi:hypothetical protein IWQ62_003579 [Dispira parvispora]|uniref:Phosphodiesterase n=1 Tax=Dispira parvispora TaxID=1520584 RepID=A0A9W8AQM4_9FUNG|nr:hypothetical protein IWQ62_003579 [Dispira parvispora]
MLILKFNQLPFDDLLTVERVMVTYVDKKWPDVRLNFDAWQHSTPELYGIVLAMFSQLDVMATLCITDSQMLDFIIDVARGYNHVPYHSFYHSADVVVKLFYVLFNLQGSRYLTPPNLAALMVAGLCHDVGHPGLNNLYQKHACTDLARRFGDSSILEKFSCETTEKLVTKHGLFDHLPCAVESPPHSPVNNTSSSDDDTPRITSEYLMNSITEMILMTDMAVHYQVVEQCSQLVQVVTQAVEATVSSDEESPSLFSNKSPVESGSLPTTLTETSHRVLSPPHINGNLGTTLGALNNCASVGNGAPRSHHQNTSKAPCSLSSYPSLDSLHSTSSGASTLPVLFNATQRQYFCNIVLHAVDIFNPVLPWDMCKKWSDCMVEESFHQGDLEKLHGFPITPSMDRTKTDQCQISLDFAHYIVKPFFESLAILFPFNGFVVGSLVDNIHLWEKLRDDKPPPDNNPSSQLSSPVTPVRTGRATNHAGALLGRRLSVAAGTIEITDTHCPDPWRRHSGDFLSNKRSLSLNWHRRLGGGTKQKRRILRQLQTAPSVEPGIFAFDQSQVLSPTHGLSESQYDKNDQDTLSPTNERMVDMVTPNWSSPGHQSTGSDGPRRPTSGPYPHSRDYLEENRRALLRILTKSQRDEASETTATLASRVRHDDDDINRKYRRSSSLDVSSLLRSKPTEERPCPPPVSANPRVHDSTPAGDVNAS